MLIVNVWEHCQEFTTCCAIYLWPVLTNRQLKTLGYHDSLSLSIQFDWHQVVVSSPVPYMFYCLSYSHTDYSTITRKGKRSDLSICNMWFRKRYAFHNTEAQPACLEWQKWTKFFENGFEERMHRKSPEVTCYQVFFWCCAKVITFMVDCYYIYGGVGLLHLWWGRWLHLWLIFITCMVGITFMGDAYCDQFFRNKMKTWAVRIELLTRKPYSANMNKAKKPGWWKRTYTTRPCNATHVIPQNRNEPSTNQNVRFFRLMWFINILLRIHLQWNLYTTSDYPSSISHVCVYSHTFILRVFLTLTYSFIIM